jgi:hypothetical protein
VNAARSPVLVTVHGTVNAVFAGTLPEGPVQETVSAGPFFDAKPAAETASA